VWGQVRGQVRGQVWVREIVSVGLAVLLCMSLQCGMLKKSRRVDIQTWLNRCNGRFRIFSCNGEVAGHSIWTQGDL